MYVYAPSSCADFHGKVTLSFEDWIGLELGFYKKIERMKRFISAWEMALSAEKNRSGHEAIFNLQHAVRGAGENGRVFASGFIFKFDNGGHTIIVSEKPIPDADSWIDDINKLGQFLNKDSEDGDCPVDNLLDLHKKK